MGGCRCSFRQCARTSYNSRNTHFFHYPIKDKKRCDEWIKRSNNPAFLMLPAIKLKNKVVCDQHFNNDCFMNYKRDRLVYNAVPVLSINAEEDSIPDILKTATELIKDRQQIDCTDFTLPQSNSDDTKLTVTDGGASGLIFSEDDCNNDIKIEQVRSHITSLQNAPLNTTNKLQINATNGNRQKIKEQCNKPISCISKSKTCDLKRLENKSIAHSANKSNAKSFDLSHYSAVHYICERSNNDNLKTDKDPRHNITKMAVGNIAQNNKQNYFPRITKEQLFEGIKKYLSTSMEVLLRMELFSSADRVWEADERELSVEFLNFGTEVYSYMTDELRWRLPSSSLVKQWKTDTEEDKRMDS